MERVRALAPDGIDPRPDGGPWLADTASLAHALAEAEQRLAAY